MGIPIGKLSLYTLGAGIHPAACLPICLDVGTDNESLLEDPLYLGHKHRRITGEAYDRFISRFVGKIKKSYPNALLQWEDFSKQNAFSNLDRFRDKILSFNDDIQGTGAMVLAGILGAMKINDEPIEKQRFLVFGAGAGGVGAARQIKNSLTGKGLSDAEAGALIYTLDSRGLITTGRKGLEDYKSGFAKDNEALQNWKVKDPDHITLEEVVVSAKITVLLGTSGQPGTFTKPVVEAMAKNTPAPLIFPLSNPTSKTEVVPEDVYKWSKGKAIVATGSPFDDVEYEGRRFRIGQGNNVFMFPGVGLGVLAAKASVITDEMFNAAADSLAEMTPADARETHGVYPKVSELAKVSEQVALAVYLKAVEQGVARAPADIDPAEVIRQRIWKPAYLSYRRAKK
jgi:malate dehydrogenase (oxaloacetate-decarboxylating)